MKAEYKDSACTIFTGFHAGRPGPLTSVALESGRAPAEGSLRALAGPSSSHNLEPEAGSVEYAELMFVSTL